MLQPTILYDREILRVRHVSCHVTDRRPSAVEDPECDGIVLPLRGAFMRHVSRTREVIADSGHAQFFAVGVPHRISHPVTDRDDCLTLDLSAEVLREVLIAETGTERLGDLGTHALLPPATLAARSLLCRRLRLGVASELETEETALAIARVALRAARRRNLHVTRGRANVDVVRFTLLETPEEKWTLSALARLAGASPYHLARRFRAETGVSIHQYQTRARLARAIDLVLDTPHDLTSIAHDLGFASHSHFTSVFHRMVGATPSELRRRATRRIVAAARTFLTATMS